MTSTEPRPIIPSIMLRRLAPEDTWAVHQLFAALHTYNASLDARFRLADAWPQVLDEYLQHVCDHPHRLTLLAWAEAEPVGLLMLDGHTDSPLFQHRQWAELVALYIVPAHRGSGLAARMVAAGAAWAQDHGYDRVQLYVTRSNVSARQFYARRGFTPVQEVWRLDVAPRHRLAPHDPDCEAIYAQGHHLLSTHQHGIGEGHDDLGSVR
ncbi:GCN5-related N-acetyltransferase [Herpetosiphon aurantiacus DSM 785]|uniref:GCN5-related N-acetyltransferase n=1 Tax=Herpetosiphon aurantiacus (strain ATCC 23779 / DSM 785 / 114-95) TaxID=316274 RepID=A9AW54_HERA2|nr:GCN5-related N-acetyltransferase [Herpetosiphon aurantiacus DSM 785]